MAFLRSYTGSESALVIEGRGLWLRPPHMSDYAHWAELRALSRDHLVPWEPQWSRDELSRFSYRRRVKHYQRELAEDQGYAFLILSAGDDRLLGGLTFTNVRRGVTQSASLGYWLGLPFAGQGIMTEAVRAASSHAFEVLKLHRVEAATQPTNPKSIRVLENNGYEREGFARSYLKINGVWADHVLFGRVASDTVTSGVAQA